MLEDHWSWRREGRRRVCVGVEGMSLNKQHDQAHGHFVNMREANGKDLTCPPKSLAHHEFREHFSISLNISLQIPSHFLF